MKLRSAALRAGFGRLAAHFILFTSSFILQKCLQSLEEVLIEVCRAARGKVVAGRDRAVECAGLGERQ